MRNRFRLMMGGDLVDHFKTLEAALAFGHQVNTNRTRSSGMKKKKLSIEIYIDSPPESLLVLKEAH